MKPIAYSMAAGVAFVSFEVYFWARMQSVMQLIYAGKTPAMIWQAASGPLRANITFTLIGSAVLIGLMLYLAGRSFAAMVREVKR